MTTLYEAGVKECESLQPLRVQEAMKDIRSSLEDYFEQHKSEKNKYYLLLCNENKDYTVFIIPKELDEDGINKIHKNLFECLMNRGEIYGSSLTFDKVAIEIWIRYDEDEKPHCYFFFSFDKGIVDCREEF